MRLLMGRTKKQIEPGREAVLFTLIFAVDDSDVAVFAAVGAESPAGGRCEAAVSDQGEMAQSHLLRTSPCRAKRHRLTPRRSALPDDSSPSTSRIR